MRVAEEERGVVGGDEGEGRDVVEVQHEIAPGGSNVGMVSKGGRGKGKRKVVRRCLSVCVCVCPWKKGTRVFE